MTTFLPEDVRAHLIEGLTTLGMPQEMAEKFTSWPDDADQMDLNLTALINQTADYKDRMDHGDSSVKKYLIANVMLLISYMSRAEERGWNELQLPMMNDACNAHNLRWRQQLQ